MITKNKNMFVKLDDKEIYNVKLGFNDPGKKRGDKINFCRLGQHLWGYKWKLEGKDHGY